jgi:hypothetical protein
LLSDWNLYVKEIFFFMGICNDKVLETGVVLRAVHYQGFLCNSGWGIVEGIVRYSYPRT